jgi:hypothetical protein
MTEPVTRVASIHELGWTVLRIKTRSSAYTLGLNEVQKCAILQGRSNSTGDTINARDTNPRLDGQSLWDVPRSSWPGKSLQVSTASTSPIVEVSLETDERAITSITLGTSRYVEREPQRSLPKPDRKPYPIEDLELLESAAAYIDQASRNERLIRDLMTDADWLDRLKLAAARANIASKRLAKQL